MNNSKIDFFLCLLATLLAFSVIVLGAYTRLSDAGLGCPDWPGCYGRIFVPDETAVVEQVNQAYPERPLEQSKAWKEMIHRYAAATLGLIIMLLAAKSWGMRFQGRPTEVTVPTVLFLLVMFQGALGMWTVTLLLKPVVVAAHLLGGMTILSLLYWSAIRAVEPRAAHARTALTTWVIAGLGIVFSQIALGGWTSANYSALVCTDFPKCQGQWWPQMDFSEGFILWRGLGIDYEGGVLDGAARTAIHVSHRLGALLTLLVVSSVAVRAISCNLVKSGVIVLLVLLAQLSLGIANVLLLLPLPLAVAHNGVAALLLLSLVNLLYFSFSSDAATE